MNINININNETNKRFNYHSNIKAGKRTYLRLKNITYLIAENNVACVA